MTPATDKPKLPDPKRFEFAGDGMWRCRTATCRAPLLLRELAQHVCEDPRAHFDSGLGAGLG